MTKLRYKIQKSLFTFIGNIRWSGFLHPFWIIINSKTFQIKGRHYREIEQLIRPGDVLVRRFEGYLDKIFLPGWWNHAGIYIGPLDNKNHRVVHATSDGVVVEDLIDFTRTDHVVVLRAPENLRAEAILRAKDAVGSDYDFAFEFNDSLRFSCTELICHCYKNDQWVIQGKKRFGRYTVVADDIVDADHLKVIWTSTGLKVGPPPPMPHTPKKRKDV